MSTNYISLESNYVTFISASFIDLTLREHLPMTPLSNDCLKLLNETKILVNAINNEFASTNWTASFYEGNPAEFMEKILPIAKNMSKTIPLVQTCIDAYYK